MVGSEGSGGVRRSKCVVVKTFSLVKRSECAILWLSDSGGSLMFLRRIQREKNGKMHTYWALAESYRTAGGPRQRIVS